MSNLGSRLTVVLGDRVCMDHLARGAMRLGNAQESSAYGLCARRSAGLGSGQERFLSQARLPMADLPAPFAKGGGPNKGDLPLSFWL